MVPRKIHTEPKEGHCKFQAAEGGGVGIASIKESMRLNSNVFGGSSKQGVWILIFCENNDATEWVTIYFTYYFFVSSLAPPPAPGRFPRRGLNTVDS